MSVPPHSPSLLTPTVPTDAAPGATLPALQTPDDAGTGVTLYPHGASLTGVRFGGCEPLLYLSPEAVLDGSKPIRGGVPVCFPWFGVHPCDPNQAKHGTVRNKTWDVVHAHAGLSPVDGGDESNTLGFDALLKTQTDRFAAAYRVVAESNDTATGGTLQLSFHVRNSTDQPQLFELALHTYFVVGDVRQVNVTGLHGRRLIDNLADTESPMRPLRERHRFTEDREQLRFDGECDRVYLDVPGPITLNDPVLARTIELTQTGCPSAVVWNPHVETSKGFSDLPDNAWPGFLCIESGLIADDAVTLAPDGEHLAEITIRQQAL
ncbi:MAG: D-hexose-6-phosphate mutarotase [Planctomycetota bacterium]